MKPIGRFSVALILVWSLFGGSSGWTGEVGAQDGGYSYYYKGSKVSLNPSRTLIAVEEGNEGFASVARDNQLIRDPLSEREGLKSRSLGLYRAVTPKGKGKSAVDLGSMAAALSGKTSGVVQPVFEQGQALLIPSDEVIVGFKEETTLEEARDYLTAYFNSLGIVGLREHQQSSYILRISEPSNGRALEVSRSLAGLEKVSYAEPNFIVLMLGDKGPEGLSFGKFPAGEKFSAAYGGKGKEEAATEELVQAAPNWTVLANLGFESDSLPQGWEIGFLGSTEAYWGPTGYVKHGGSRSIYCAAGGSQGRNAPGPAPINMAAYLRSPVMNLSSYEEVYVELWFYAKNELDAGGLYDAATVLVMDAGGSKAWQVLAVAYDGDCTQDPTTSNGWRKVLFRVPPFMRVADAKFLFTFESDGNTQTEGAYIDDIRIVATSNVDTEALSNDTYSARQYELKNVGQIAGLVKNRSDLHIPEAWGLVDVSPNVVVAVIDDGVELNHPDLNLVTGYDPDGSVGGQPRGNPRGAHGTNCAGNVGAVKGNGIGVVGTAPGVKIMPIYKGSTVAEIANAIGVAVTHGADILSNSWGGVGAPSTTIEDAIKAALAAGRIVLFAAGNGPDRPPWTYQVAFPGNLTETTNVICVGASSPTDQHKSASSSDGIHSWGSSYVGPGPDVVAPGPWSYATDLLGAEGYNDGSQINPANAASADYNHAFGGTSSSTPKVAGIVALMLSKNPNLTPAQVKNILKNTADSIGTADKTGAGRVNAFKAVQAVQGGGGTYNLRPFKPAGWSKPIVLSKVKGTNKDALKITKNDVIFLDWAVLNDSDEALAVDFKVKLFVDRKLRATFLGSNPLKAGWYTYYEDYKLGRLAAGTHVISIVADSEDDVEETDETDNKYARKVVINVR